MFPRLGTPSSVNGESFRASPQDKSVQDESVTIRLWVVEDEASFTNRAEINFS